MINPLQSNLDAYALGSDFNSANQTFQAHYRTGISKSSDDVKAEAGLSATDIEEQNKLSSGAVGDTIGGFGSMLKNEMSRVNQMQMTANDNMQDYATGGEIPLHQVMMSVNKAEMSLKLATQVRNKMVNAYQDIARMQI
jgi:flagellar hook-basal body complex protein FliE